MYVYIYICMAQFLLGFEPAVGPVYICMYIYIYVWHNSCWDLNLFSASVPAVARICKWAATIASFRYISIAIIAAQRCNLCGGWSLERCSARSIHSARTHVCGWFTGCAHVSTSCPPVCSRINCDFYSASTQSTGVRFHLLAHRWQEHTDGCMVAGMCKYVSTLWQRLQTTACSGTRQPCASPRPPVRSRINCDLCSASTQSTGVRFHLLAHKLQEHTDGCMVAGMCKYVSTLWQQLHTTASSGTR